MKVARSHTTPISDYKKFVETSEGEVVWEKDNRRILVVHLPNWLSRNPSRAPRVLAFMAVHGRTYVGTYDSLVSAKGVLME